MTAAPTTTSKKRNLTPKQWAEAEALWESGTVIYEDLVKKFGCSTSTFERHFKKHKTVKGAAAAAAKKKVEERLAAAAVDEATLTAARIRETKESHYKMASGLAQLAFNEILQAKKDGNPVSVALNNLKSLEAAMNVIKKAGEERYKVLGLDRPDAVDPDDLPELLITELTAEQIKELRDRDLTELDEIAAKAAVPAGGDDTDDEEDLEDDGDSVVEES